MLVRAAFADVIRYGVSFKSTAALAANTPETVFAPGSNVNGAYLLGGQWLFTGAGATSLALLSKTSGPTSVTDGDVIAMQDWIYISGSTYVSLRVREMHFVPAGRGLYSITSAAETSGNRSYLYLLL